MNKLSVKFLGWGLIVFLVIINTACDDKTVYNQNKDFENAKWFIKNECKFEIEIEDPAQAYNLHYNVRNNLTYAYYNLYITRYLFDENGKKLDENLDELMLADEKTGKPLGSGLGDIFDHKILIKKAMKFPKKGKYVIKIKQFMRQDPLPDILSFGVAVEKNN